MSASYTTTLTDSYNTAVRLYATATTTQRADYAMLWAAKCVLELEAQGLPDPGDIDYPLWIMMAAARELGFELETA